MKLVAVAVWTAVSLLRSRRQAPCCGVLYFTQAGWERTSLVPELAHQQFCGGLSLLIRWPRRLSWSLEETASLELCQEEQQMQLAYYQPILGYTVTADPPKCLSQATPLPTQLESLSALHSLRPA